MIHAKKPAAGHNTVDQVGLKMDYLYANFDCFDDYHNTQFLDYFHLNWTQYLSLDSEKIEQTYRFVLNNV